MILVWVPLHFSDFTMLSNKENKPPWKRPVATKGDGRLNLLINFSGMLRCSKKMTSALEEVLILLKDDQPTKTNVRQARALVKALSTCSNQNGAFIDDCMRKSSGRDFCTRFTKQEIAEENLERKRQTVLTPKTANKRQKKESSLQGLKGLSEKLSEKLSANPPFATPKKIKNRSVTPSNSPSTRSQDPAMYLKEHEDTRNLDIEPPIHENGCYDMLECVLMMEKFEIKPSILFRLLVTDRYPNRPLILCCKTGLYRYRTNYKNGKSPLPGEFGDVVGNPRKISLEKRNNEINSLIHASRGQIETLGTTSYKIQKIEAENLRAQGIIRPVKPPCRSTANFYHLMAGNEEGVSLTKRITAQDKNARRRIASTSIRNCLSQVCTVASMQFEPGRWEPPANISQGCIILWKMVQEAMECPMKPRKAILINTDATSYWSYVGCAAHTGSKDELARVARTALERDNRNKSSIWEAVDSNEKTCNGIRAHWQFGWTNEQLLPICQITKGLSKEEMPNDKFIVVEIFGMSHNAHMVIGDERPGYACFLRKDCEMSVFHEWYNGEIIRKSLANLRKNMPDTERPAIHYMDSDTPNLKHLLREETMAMNLEKLFMEYAKCAAKATACFQTADKDEGFKNQKRVSKTTTLQNKTTPLKSEIERGFAREARFGRLKLKQRTRTALVDLLATAPTVYGKSYKDSNQIKKAWIDCGYLDEKTYSCPDVFKIMEATSITWTDELRKDFMDFLPSLLKEAFMTDSITGIKEESYDKLGVPLDSDYHGTEYPLVKATVITCRSTCITRKNLLEGLRKKAKALMESKKDAQLELLTEGERLLNGNKECELLMLQLLEKPEGTILSNLPVPELDFFAKRKLVSDLLRAFIVCRSTENACEKMALPKKKGKVEDVNDPNRNERCLIGMARDLFQSPVIAKVPVIEAESENGISTPAVLQVHPTVIKFQSWHCNQRSKSNLTEEWCSQAIENVRSIELSGSNRVIANYNSFNEHIDIAVELIGNRLIPYTTKRLPQDKRHLHLGVHWVWDSFSKKLDKLAAMMILSGHLLEKEKLECRQADRTLLGDHSMFAVVSETGDVKNLDGSYLFLHGSSFIRAGAASRGFYNRYVQHERASRIESEAGRRSTFYRRFPHKESLHKDPHGLRWGQFQHLSQMVGIGFQRTKKQKIVELFEWDDLETNELAKLSGAGGNGDSLVDKQYRHICYLCELIYGVCIDLNGNISSNPGCEWQLGYFGDS